MGTYVWDQPRVQANIHSLLSSEELITKVVSSLNSSYAHLTLIDDALSSSEQQLQACKSDIGGLAKRNGALEMQARNMHKLEDVLQNLIVRAHHLRVPVTVCRRRWM